MLLLETTLEDYGGAGIVASALGLAMLWLKSLLQRGQELQDQHNKAIDRLAEAARESTSAMRESVEESKILRGAVLHLVDEIREQRQA